MVIDRSLEKLAKIIDKQSKKARRRSALIAALEAFACLSFCFSFIILAAELASPVPSFIFCVGAGVYLLLKSVKKQSKKAR